jgi:hypothetical protein
MRISGYFAFGLLALMLSGAAQYYGYGFGNITEVKNVPKSVRENPGVYRSHYRGIPRWFGGK